MTHEKLLKLNNFSVTCKIEGLTITDAKIRVEDESIYICQNMKAGVFCRDKLGYKYSWLISNIYDTYEKMYRRCTDIEIISEPIKIILGVNKIYDCKNGYTLICCKNSMRVCQLPPLKS